MLHSFILGTEYASLISTIIIKIILHTYLTMTDFRNFVRLFLAFAVGILLCYGCKSKNDVPVEITDAFVDTATRLDVAQDDSIPGEVEVPEPPKKADELFDDFAFAFMKNRKFQKERIEWPLAYNVDGRSEQISSSQWKYDSMYSRYEIYTLIFADTKGDKAAKDTTLHRVVVEELDLDSQRAKSYDFERKNGEWMLTSLTNGPMDESENSDFYRFYHKFATDEDFRQAHIVSPLPFSTFDDDEFRVVETTIDPADFDECAPELPKSKITNILYGQKYKNSNLRVLSLRAHASGMECQMVFKRANGEWQLTRLEN